VYAFGAVGKAEDPDRADAFLPAEGFHRGGVVSVLPLFGAAESQASAFENLVQFVHFGVVPQEHGQAVFFVADVGHNVLLVLVAGQSARGCSAIPAP
jgi:hypothetical protein